MYIYHEVQTFKMQNIQRSITAQRVLNSSFCAHMNLYEWLYSNRWYIFFLTEHRASLSINSFVSWFFKTWVILWEFLPGHRQPETVLKRRGIRRHVSEDLLLRTGSPVKSFWCSLESVSTRVIMWTEVCYLLGLPRVSSLCYLGTFKLHSWGSV